MFRARSDTTMRRTLGKVMMQGFIPFSLNVKGCINWELEVVLCFYIATTIRAGKVHAAPCCWGGSFSAAKVFFSLLYLFNQMNPLRICPFRIKECVLKRLSGPVSGDGETEV